MFWVEKSLFVEEFLLEKNFWSRFRFLSFSHRIKDHPSPIKGGASLDFIILRGIIRLI